MVAVLGRWSGHVRTIITEVGTHMRQCWRFGWLLMPSPATRRRVGAYYRSMAYYGSMRTPKGPQQAIVATAHTIACTVYHLLKTGELYVKQSAGNFEAQCRERVLRQLTRRTHKLGYALTAMPAPSAYQLPNPVRPRGFLDRQAYYDSQGLNLCTISVS
jgi:hypothetical protein